MEDTRLLGLISRRRHLFVGAPLVAELSSAQLAAVLTHELTHHSNRDTRFAGIAYRSRRAFVPTLSTMNRDDYLQRAVDFLLRHCGALMLRASTRLSRRQEGAADVAAADAVGSAAAFHYEDHNSDRRWAAYGLVSAGRYAEAVPLFARLGTDASGRPWEDYGDNAIDVFDSCRKRACAAG